MAIDLNANTPAEAITALYVGYFDRAPDPEGLEYWIGRLNDGMPLAQIAASFAVQPEATSTYPFLAGPNVDNATVFLQEVYQNLFNRTVDVDSDGFQYWLDQLTAPGADVGQIIINIISGAQGDDIQAVQNKVEVGVDFAVSVAAVGITTFSTEVNVEAYALANGIIDPVTADESTVAAAKELTDDFVDDFLAGGSLSAALADLVAAEEAEVVFLEENDFDDVTEVAAALTEAQDLLDTDIAADGSLRQLEATVVAAEANLGDAVEAVADVTGLTSAAARLNAEDAQLDSALEAEAVAYQELESEGSVFDIRNESVSGIDVTDDLTAVTQDDAVVQANLDDDEDLENLIVLGANGQLKIADGVNASNYVGLDALLADAQLAYDTAVAADDAVEEFEAALTTVLELEGVDTTAEDFNVSTFWYESDDNSAEYSTSFAGDAGAPLTAALFAAREDLADAQVEVQERVDLIADVEAAQALVDELEALQADTAAAIEAIEALGYVAPQVIDEADGDELAAADNDLFVLAETDGEIIDFGTEGDDTIYIGDGFTAVNLAADANIETQRLGDATVREVFVQQQGDDAVLYFEEVASAGNSANGFEGTTITLNDVNADDVEVGLTGFITLNTDVDLIA